MAKTDEKQIQQRWKKGVVTSDKGDKTVVVTVTTYKQHPKYKKRYPVHSKFHAHDENNTCKEGDEVVIVETRPMSKLKRWMVKTS